MIGRANRFVFYIDLEVQEYPEIIFPSPCSDHTFLPASDYVITTLARLCFYVSPLRAAGA